MSDHDTYRRLMREAERAQAPSAWGRLMDKLQRRSRGLNPSRQPAINRLRDELIRANAFDDPHVYRNALRTMRAELERDAVKAGEMRLNDTSIPLRAGIEAIQNRLSRSYRKRLQMWWRVGPSGKKHPVYRRSPLPPPKPRSRARFNPRV